MANRPLAQALKVSSPPKLRSNLRFEDALSMARTGAAIAREGKDYYLKVFPDGMYIGIFATPDKPLLPFRFLRSQSIMAEDWKIVEV